MGLFNPSSAAQVNYSRISQMFSDQEFFIQQVVDTLVANSCTQLVVDPISSILSGGTSSVILDAESTRRGASMRNISEETVWIDIRPNFGASDCLAPIEPNGYYDFPFPFSGSVWAYSANGGGALEIRDYRRIQEL
jgi:hypothetical protein